MYRVDRAAQTLTREVPAASPFTGAPAAAEAARAPRNSEPEDGCCFIEIRPSGSLGQQLSIDAAMLNAAIHADTVEKASPDDVLQGSIYHQIATGIDSSGLKSNVPSSDAATGLKHGGADAHSSSLRSQSNSRRISFTSNAPIRHETASQASVHPYVSSSISKSGHDATPHPNVAVQMSRYLSRPTSHNMRDRNIGPAPAAATDTAAYPAADCRREGRGLHSRASPIPVASHLRSASRPQARIASAPLVKRDAASNGGGFMASCSASLQSTLSKAQRGMANAADPWWPSSRGSTAPHSNILNRYRWKSEKNYLAACHSTAA